MTRLVSPNDIHNAAINVMLDGREPSSDMDWQLCVNFWAANIESGVEVAAVPLLGKVLGCPLSAANMVAIAKHQADLKLARKKNG